MPGERPTIEETSAAFSDGYITLTVEEQHLVQTIYRLLAAGRPAPPDAIASASGWATADVEERLGESPAVFRDDDGAVVGFWGLAAAEITSHRMDIEGMGTAWTWCSYDTLFIPHLLDATAQVSSTCPTTEDQVRLTVSRRGVSGLEPAETVVSLLTPDKPFGDDVRQAFCHFVHFFTSPEAAEQWTDGNPGDVLAVHGRRLRGGRAGQREGVPGSRRGRSSPMTQQTSRWIADVDGMSRGACERHVARAIESVDGTDASASWRDGTATFAAADVDQSGLADAVSQAGYQLRGLRAEAPLASVPRSGDDGFDLAIIGAGSAAFAAAIKATETGARVVMIEQGTPGGTCVNVGCVPSKALLAAADAYHRARTHPFAGIPHLNGAHPDLAALVAQKDELVGELRQAKYLDLADAYGFELRQGTARFAGPDTITVDGEPLRASNYLIATGARPAVPPIAGLADVDYLTSTTALELTEVPSRLAVIGANAIGLELGQAFSRLGSQVTFLDMAERVAPFEEPEVSAALAGVLTDEGARVVTSARITRVTQAPDGTVTLEGDVGDAGSKLQADRVLVATGRVPNTQALSLDAAGVKVDSRGFVTVDEHLRTTNPRIWAAGDVTASAQFVYVSAAEGAIAAGNAITGAGERTDYRTLPRVTFTSPPLAAVGLTEAQAVDAGHQVVTSVLALEHVPRAIVNRDTRGLVKLVADSATGRLLGVHMAGEGAGDVIQAGVYALMAGLTVDEIAGAFHPYLTMAEGLKLAAQAFDRDVARLSCCAA